MANSRKDPEKVAAKEQALKLMGELADTALVALDEFAEDPRWCGLPGPDVGSYRSKGDLGYPISYELIPFVREEARKPKASRNGYSQYDHLVLPTDEASGHQFHTFQILAFAEMFRQGIPARKPEYNKPRQEWKLIDESPSVFLDRVRGALRYSERFDDKNILTTAFALFECVKVGKLEEDPEAKVTTPGVLPKRQKYEYRPLSEQKLKGMRMIHHVQAGIRRVFDHVALSLLPKELSKKEEHFLKWISERGDVARGMEVRKWLSDNNYGGGGQDPAAPYFRKFCDKEGNAGTRTPWRVRPEALALVGLKPAVQP